VRLRAGDEIKSASGRSRVRQNAGLRREFQARVLANAATNAGFIDARFLARLAAASKQGLTQRREDAKVEMEIFASSRLCVSLESCAHAARMIQ